MGRGGGDRTIVIVLSYLRPAGTHVIIRILYDDLAWGGITARVSLETLSDIVLYIYHSRYTYEFFK